MAISTKAAAMPEDKGWNAHGRNRPGSVMLPREDVWDRTMWAFRHRP